MFWSYLTIVHQFQEPSRKELTSVQEDEEVSQQPTSEDLKSPTTSSAERESDVSQDKSPKKPDKILPCPRCKSMDTKFCYYNNYNVHQPRHFCKNCQRYWTAGGTMRNVPIGAGRRKNKISCSSSPAYQQITVPETLQNEFHSAVFTFGSDSPHAFYQPSYHVPFYPNPTYWSGCLPPNSTTLGKHSRDGDNIFHSNLEKEKPNSRENSNGVLIPKTLRIDDPNEVAKSSIWSTLGIKNEKGNSLSGGGIFRAFRSKGDDRNHVVVESSVLQANPAALSRSYFFHERT